MTAALVEPRAESEWSRRAIIFFAEKVPAILQGAWSYREAERLAQQVVLPYADLLGLSTLDQALKAWVENENCRSSWGMQSSAVKLYRATGHLLPSSLEIWRNFVHSVREIEEEDSQFRYDELEAALGD